MWLIHSCKWLTHLFDVTHSCSFVWRDAFMCVVCLTDMSVTECCRDFIYLPHLKMCKITHSYLWHDYAATKYTRLSGWLLYACNMTHSYVRHASYMCVTRLIHMCGMPHSWVWHDSVCETDSHKPRFALLGQMSHVTYVYEAYRTYECIMSRMWMSHVTKVKAWYHNTSFITHGFIQYARQRTAKHCNTSWYHNTSFVTHAIVHHTR